MRMLTWDSETRPHEGTTWGPKYEANILWWTRYGGMISISGKYSDQKHARVFALPDYKNYRVGREDDKQMLIDFCKFAEEADVFIFQNGDRFDLPTLNARLIFHRLPPLRPRQTIDTLKVFKKYFRFPANNLDEVCEYLGIGRKLRTDKNLWKDCLNPALPEAERMRAWRYMKKYNIHDVELTEEVCKLVLPFTVHAGIPNSNVYNKTILRCTNPMCGGTALKKRGPRRLATGEVQTYQCNSCGKYSQSKREAVHAKAGQAKMLR